MPPVVLQTQESTINIEQAQRVVDMSETIYLLHPEEAPFTALSRKLSKKSTKNPKFEWLEDEQVPWVDQANGAYLVGATSIVVDNAAYFAPGDLVRNFRNGEVFRVTAVTLGTNTLTVTRGWGTTAAAGNDNDFLEILGPAIAEGQPVGTPRVTKKVPKFNYTEIFRHPLKLTKTLEASTLYGGNERAFQRRKVAIQHNMAIERALWFGARNEDTAVADAPIRSTGGVTSFVTTNKDTLANDAALTLATFDAFWEKVFFYGSGTRWAFGSPHMMTLINALGQAKLQVYQMELGRARNQTFGISVVQYVSPHGIVNLVMTRLFKDWIASSGTNAAGKLLIALDFDTEDGVAYRYLRDTQLMTELQVRGDDFYLDEYLTECGLQFAQERRHGILEISG